LSTAVAVSSCFPPVFKPVSLNFDPKKLTGGKAQGPTRNENIRNLTFSDGGVYDNLGDRKSTRLNSSHVEISYAVFCLKKKTRCQRLRQRARPPWTSSRLWHRPRHPFPTMPICPA